MADIVGRTGTAPFPYLQGLNGPPSLAISHTSTVLHLRLSTLGYRASSIFSNDSSFTGPNTGGTQVRGSSCTQVGGVFPMAVKGRHR